MHNSFTRTSELSRSRPTGNSGSPHSFSKADTSSMVAMLRPICCLRALCRLSNCVQKQADLFAGLFTSAPSVSRSRWTVSRSRWIYLRAQDPPRSQAVDRAGLVVRPSPRGCLAVEGRFICGAALKKKATQVKGLAPRFDIAQAGGSGRVLDVVPARSVARSLRNAKIFCSPDSLGCPG